MTTYLPVEIDLARHDDLNVPIVFVDEEGDPVAVTAADFSLALRWRSITKSIPLTARSGETNILDGYLALASIQDMPIGQTFLGDLVYASGGVSGTWGTLAVTRKEIVQDTDDLGPRVVQVVREAGVTVSISLAGGVALAQAQAAANAAAASADEAAESVETAQGLLTQVEELIAPNSLIWNGTLVTWG